MAQRESNQFSNVLSGATTAYKPKPSPVAQAKDEWADLATPDPSWEDLSVPRPESHKQAGKLGDTLLEMGDKQGTINKLSKSLNWYDPRMALLGLNSLAEKGTQFASDTLAGVKEFPSMISDTLSASPMRALGVPAKIAGGAAKQAVSAIPPLVDVAMGNETPESARDKLAEGTVNFATGTGPAIYGLAGAPKAILKNQAPKAAERMTRYSKRGAGASGPERVNLEGKMETTLKEAGTPPITQSANDAHIMQNMERSGTELKQVADAVPPQTTIPKPYLREAYQRAISSLDPKNPDHAGALRKLEYIAGKIEALPEEGNFHQARALKIDLDNEISAGKGHTPTVKEEVHADTTKKALVGSIRDLLSEFAPDKAAWDKANESFSAWKSRAEIVERQRPEVLAASKKGPAAQTEAAAGRVVYGPSDAPAAGAAIGKQALGATSSAIGESGRLLRGKMSVIDRAIAKGNEKLLGLSDRLIGSGNYQDFNPSYVKPPSPLIAGVRKNQAGLSPEEVVGVPVEGTPPFVAPEEGGYVKMGGFEYPRNYAANLDVPSPAVPQKFNQRVYGEGPGVEEINLAGTKPHPTPFDAGSVPPKPSFIGAEEGLVGQAAETNRARVVPVAGNQPPVGSKVSSFDTAPQETGLIPEAGTMAPPQPNHPFAAIEEPRTGQLAGKQETLPGAAPLAAQERLGLPEQDPFYAGKETQGQGQLFDVKQTPSPKYDPNSFDSATMSDLSAMLDEIKYYIEQNPRHAEMWKPDLELIQSEINKRMSGRQ